MTMKKKSLKLKELLKENSVYLGMVGLGGESRNFDWNGKSVRPIKEDDEKPTDKKQLIFGDDKEDDITEDMKKAFYEIVSEYGAYGKSIYREHKLKEVTETICKIGKLSEKIALSETDDWSDTLSVQKDMKNLNESVKIFEKTAKEVSILQNRLESCYEDIGSKLNKYFDVKNADDGQTEIK
jgi:hypothetical protein